MEQGVIFTEDKKDIEVFFLKPQQLKPLIDDSIESDNKDCYNDDLHPPNTLAMWSAVTGGELDVNENSAGGGAHGCPVGHKGETGWKGYDSVYDVILDTIRAFENTQLNISSETAQEILALSIEKKIKDYERKTT